jgi:hypothetical protein
VITYKPSLCCGQPFHCRSLQFRNEKRVLHRSVHNSKFEREREYLQAIFQHVEMIFGCQEMTGAGAFAPTAFLYSDGSSSCWRPSCFQSYFASAKSFPNCTRKRNNRDRSFPVAQPHAHATLDFLDMNHGNLFANMLGESAVLCEDIMWLQHLSLSSKGNPLAAISPYCDPLLHPYCGTNYH